MRPSSLFPRLSTAQLPFSSLLNCDPNCVDFATSEGELDPSIYTDPRYAPKQLQMLPMIATSIVPIYNIPELTAAKLPVKLRFTREDLPDMFMGKTPSSSSSH